MEKCPNTQSSFLKEIGNSNAKEPIKKNTEFWTLSEALMTPSTVGSDVTLCQNRSVALTMAIGATLAL